MGGRSGPLGVVRRCGGLVVGAVGGVVVSRLHGGLVLGRLVHGGLVLGRLPVLGGLAVLGRLVGVADVHVAAVVDAAAVGVLDDGHAACGEVEVAGAAGRAVEGVADDAGVDDGGIGAAVAAGDIRFDDGDVDVGGVGRAAVEVAGAAVRGLLVLAVVLADGRLLHVVGGLGGLVATACDADVAAVLDVAAVGVLVHRHVAGVEVDDGLAVVLMPRRLVAGPAARPVGDHTGVDDGGVGAAVAAVDVGGDRGHLDVGRRGVAEVGVAGPAVPAGAGLAGRGLLDVVAGRGRLVGAGHRLAEEEHSSGHTGDGQAVAQSSVHLRCPSLVVNVWMGCAPQSHGWARGRDCVSIGAAALGR